MHLDRFKREREEKHLTEQETVAFIALSFKYSQGSYHLQGNLIRLIADLYQDLRINTSPNNVRKLVDIISRMKESGRHSHAERNDHSEMTRVTGLAETIFNKRQNTDSNRDGLAKDILTTILERDVKYLHKRPSTNDKPFSFFYEYIILRNPTHNPLFDHLFDYIADFFEGGRCVLDAQQQEDLKKLKAKFRF